MLAATRPVAASIAACLWLAAPTAGAQQAPALKEAASAPARPAAGAEGPARAEALGLELSLEATRLSPEALRAAIARELGVHVTLQPDARAPTRLRVQVRGQLAHFEFHDRDHHVVRTLSLPDDDERAIETIGLIAGNLARDEAGELVASLHAARAEETAAPGSPPPPAPPAAPEPAPPPAPPAASHDPERDEPPLERSIVNLSLAHPIALYPDARRRRFHLELGFGYSRVGGLDGFALTLGAVHVDRAAEGFVLGVGYTWARLARGVQLSAGVNATRELEGAQVSGGVNLVNGTATGFQVALVSVAEDVRGLQTSLVSVSGDVQGGQASLVSVAKDVRGLQTSLVNVAKVVQGGQASLVSVAGDVQGGQTAVFNLAGDVDGGQVSLSNIAEDVRGGQIGLINVGGHVRGVQIGLVNVADRVDGFSLAPVNVIGNVRTQLVLWTAGARLPMNVGVKYRHGLFYTLWGVGYDEREGSKVLAPGAGLGVHVDFAPLFFEADAVWQHEQRITRDLPPGVHAIRYRVALGWEPIRGFALFAGGGPQLDLQPAEDPTWRPHAFAGVKIF